MTTRMRWLLAAWGMMSALLIVVSLALMNIGMARRFCLMLTTGNTVVFLISVAFRRNIERMFLIFREDFARFNSETKCLVIETSYSHGRLLGAILTMGVGIFGAYVVVLSLTDTTAYLRLIEEDGPVENTSAIFWFLAAALTLFSLVRRAASTRRSPFRSALWSYLFAVLFFIVCGGEEISWGQRLLGFDTPKIIDEVNLQHETNLHNIGSISVFANVFFCLAVGYFLVVPFVMKKRPNLERYVAYHDYPVPHRSATNVFLITLAVWLFIGIRFGTLGFHPFTFYHERYYTQMDDEVFELLAACSFFAFAAMDCLKRHSSRAMASVS